MSLADDLLDPWLDARLKGFPTSQPPLRRSRIGQQGWDVLDGDLPLPLALLKRDALQRNIGWMQRFAGEHGIDLAPHGKTTMSPQLFRHQLDAGAWGITFASVGQAAVGAAAGVTRALIANQVLNAADLHGLAALCRRHPGWRALFLVDSIEQADAIDTWFATQQGVDPFEVLIEVGVPGGRSGCRDHLQAVALARRIRAAPSLRLAGIECYEGLWASGDSAADAAFVQRLMQRVAALAAECDALDLFEADEIVLSAGGSSVFDLVAGLLKPALGRPLRALLRSGCYVTHDHGTYKRMLGVMDTRLPCSHGLQAAIEVWTSVLSRPEPGLAILNAGKRDVSHDVELPVPIGMCRRGARRIESAHGDWRVDALNDQHAYLRWPVPSADDLQVGDRVVLGISHPCTTFDKWRWMPVVDEHYKVVDAIVTMF